MILDFLTGKLSREAFFEQYPVPEEGIADVVATLLREASAARDPVGVEFGIALAHRFEVHEACARELIAVAAEPWHERHEDAVAALVTVGTVDCVDALVSIARTTYPYRDYDDDNELATRAVGALSRISDERGIDALSELLSESMTRSAAETELRRVAEARGPLARRAQLALERSKPGYR